MWWLFAAGIVTGLSIWITHFSAMLAYRPGVEVRFDAVTAIGSVIVACGIGLTDILYQRDRETIAFA
jgi:NO-binding membrane sensor protein with MHYT domain